MRRADLASRLAGDLGGSGSATAAQALLALFAKNHNLLAARVAEKMKKDDESLAPSADSVFQVARHANCAAFRAVVLKDYLPFMRSGQHLEHVPEDPPGAETSAAEAPSSNEGAARRVRVGGARPADARRGIHGPARDVDNVDKRSRDECGRGAGECLGPAVRPGRAPVPAGAHGALGGGGGARARAAGTCTLNAFRAAHGLARWADLDEMTAGEEALSRALADLYGGNVDDVELYTGFMCERNVADPGACLTAAARETAGRMRARSSPATRFSATRFCRATTCPRGGGGGVREGRHTRGSAGGTRGRGRGRRERVRGGRARDERGGGKPLGARTERNARESVTPFFLSELNERKNEALRVAASDRVASCARRRHALTPFFRFVTSPCHRRLGPR